MNDWFEQLRSELKTEMKALSEGARTQFATIRPKQVAPSRRETVNQFLNTPITDIQMAGVQMGPQGFKEFMDKNMADVEAELGAPYAAQLYEYYQNALGSPDIIQSDLEQELMGIIQANDTGP